MNTGITVNPKTDGACAVNRKTDGACAVCRYQRRRCVPDCPLAPFFPARLQKDFLNAKRLFGVSNIQAMINRVETSEQKRIVATTIIYQANVRLQHDKVNGCVRVINHFLRQIQLHEAELRLVRSQLESFRRQELG